jgi:type I restriction enzyme S subunit
MELKAGYKQTEVGVIPEDWDATLVEDISEVKSGKRLPLGSSLTDKVTPYPYIRVADMEIGTVNFSEIKYVPEDIFPAIKNYRIFIDDIFISVAGTLGIVGKIPHQLDGANLTENADRLTNIQCNRDYLMYLLMSPLIQSSIESERTLGAQPKLALTRIRKFRIPLPQTKAEQTAIANALSDADALIQSLTRLIAKKRQIKQGAMQTLLNPYENWRLKEGWVVKKLGEITDLLTGFPFSSWGYTNEGVRLLRGSNIKRGQTDWNDEITKCWPSMTSDIRRYELLEGDIVVAMDGSLVGRSFAQLKQSDLPALLLQRVARIRSKSESFDINYIKEWVCSEIFIKHCDSLKTVTAIPHISPADIYNFVLNVPEQKEEQTRIAAILSDMDAEIAALETKLAKYQQIKQGMMQNLLTGRIRLVQPENKTGAVA